MPIILAVIAAVWLPESLRQLVRWGGRDAKIAKTLKKMYPDQGITATTQFVSSEKVLFEGDGYSDEWHHEAERRGLPNVRTTPLALPLPTFPAQSAMFSASTVKEPVTGLDKASSTDFWSKRKIALLTRPAAPLTR